MLYRQNISQGFDRTTPLLLEIFESPYLNLGYWKKKSSFLEAQESLVKVFGGFSRIGKGQSILDIGFGTGQQDFDFADHFRCDKILGLNISKAQVEMAKNKIHGSRRYSKAIRFEWGDALNLYGQPEESFDRVVALESAQDLFEGKNQFLKEARRLLKTGGLLCLAEPIANHDSVYEPQGILKLQRKMMSDEFEDIQWMKSATATMREESAKLTRNQKKYTLTLKEYLLLLEKSGFDVKEIQDITLKVLPFFPAFKTRILALMKESGSLHPLRDLFSHFLFNIYLRYYFFKAKRAGYYLIRAAKK